MGTPKGRVVEHNMARDIVLSDSSIASRILRVAHPIAESSRCMQLSNQGSIPKSLSF